MMVMSSPGTPAPSTAAASTAASGSSLVSCPSSTMVSPACESARASWYLISPHTRQSTWSRSAVAATSPADPVVVTTRSSSREKSPHTRGWRPNTEVQRAASCPSVSGPSPAFTVQRWP